MILTKPQQTISDDSARFRVVVAGRRFGKTFLAINELAKFARFPNRRCLYIATTFRQAKSVIWEDLKDILYAKNWIRKTNESELTLVLVNGSTITLRSSENKDALRGTKYDFIALDEIADMHPDTWFSVLRPTLSDTGGHALFIGSPKGRNHFYDLWVQGSAQEDWSSHQYTTIQGGHVPEEEIEAAKRDLDSRRFEQEYEAKFVDNNQIVFYAFSEDNMVVKPILPEARTPLHIGMDFNISPMSAVIAQKNKDDIHIFDEIEIWGSNTYEMVKEIKNRYGSHRQMYVYPDASGAQRRTSAGGITDHIILKNSGFELKVGSINPSVKDRIASVNSVCKSNDGVVRLTVDPKCKKVIESLRKQVYKEGTRQPEKSGYDHMCDALGYLCNNLYPVKQNINTNQSKIRRATGGHYQ